MHTCRFDNVTFILYIITEPRKGADVILKLQKLGIESFLAEEFNFFRCDAPSSSFTSRRLMLSGDIHQYTPKLAIIKHRFGHQLLHPLVFVHYHALELAM